jgi:hypothetical protein
MWIRSKWTASFSLKPWMYSTAHPVNLRSGPFRTSTASARSRRSRSFEGEDLTDEQLEALADDHVWWPPAEGLAAVERLLQWAADNPEKLHRPEDVRADLLGVRVVLEAAVREGVQFNIAVSA